MSGSIGVFQIVKNEASFIGPWLMHLLPFVDEISIFDGNSTDGTLEIIEEIQKREHGHKIKLSKDKDCDVRTEEYTKLFNECLHSLSTDLAAFIHPDMWCENPEALKDAAKSKAIALWCDMDSYAGEPGGQLYRIVEGRGNKWKNIYRLRPNLGAHYYGLYGAQNEDVYFSAITGDSHEFHGGAMDLYPYKVEYSGVRIRHFSDVRPYARRFGRMKTCLLNQGYSEADAVKIATQHPRVTLKNGMGHRFEESQYPSEWKKWDAEFQKCREGKCLTHA